MIFTSLEVGLLKKSVPREKKSMNFGEVSDHQSGKGEAHSAAMKTFQKMTSTHSFPGMDKKKPSVASSLTLQASLSPVKLKAVQH